MEQSYKKYDIVLVDFGNNTDSEQSGIRPAIIVQNDMGNFFSTSTIVMPITSKQKKLNQPTHTLIKRTKSNGLNRDSVVLGECLRQISKGRIVQLIGTLTEDYEREEIRRVYQANFGE